MSQDEVIAVESSLIEYPMFSLEENLAFDEDDPDLQNNIFFDRLVDLWVDLRLYVRKECLPWLDTPEAFSNFLDLCTR